jgi:hypothetical protein
MISILTYFILVGPYDAAALGFRPRGVFYLFPCTLARLHFVTVALPALPPPNALPRDVTRLRRLRLLRRQHPRPIPRVARPYLRCTRCVCPCHCTSARALRCICLRVAASRARASPAACTPCFARILWLAAPTSSRSRASPALPPSASHRRSAHILAPAFHRYSHFAPAPQAFARTPRPLGPPRLRLHPAVLRPRALLLCPRLATPPSPHLRLRFTPAPALPPGLASP